MIYQTNLPGWERGVRLFAGAAMIACGLIGPRGLPVGYLLACVGVVTAITGFVGFCPACALAGRRSR